MSDVDSLFFDDDESVVSKVKSFLGVQYEVHTCEKCNEPCTESHTYDPNRHAEFGGEAPSWYCSECGTHYVREAESGVFSMDFYNR